MDYYINKAEDIIDDAIDYFLKRITEISEKRAYRIAKKLPSAFPLLKLSNNEFYEYAYYERTLEWFVRDYLINTILHDLLTIHGIKSMWPDNNKYIRYSTESIEEIFPFEFIIEINGEKIGVRYTSICNDEAVKLIEKYNLSKIIQIRWDSKLTTRDSYQKEYEVIKASDFFEKFFSTAEYNLFLSKILPAIETANSEIGFETIPMLSLRYLSHFKSYEDTFLFNTAFDKMRFQVLPGSNEKKSLESLFFSADDYEIMNKNFKKRGLYKALLGDKGFAKCFITAEYQFQVFKQGHNLDYTSVVCGYLKAIEQLLYKMMKIRMEFQSNENLWIKCKSLRKKQREKLKDVIRKNPDPKSNATQILLLRDNEPFFDITLTPLIWFVHDDINGWEVSDQARCTIHDFLRNFAVDCRNDHFHKDNIDDFNIVSQIRNNTLFIIYILLGGYRLTGNHQKDIEMLGIYNDEFDRLYKKINELPRGINKFIIYFKNQEPIKAYRHFTQESTIYDSNGSVAKSKIKFVKVDFFNNEIYNQAMQGSYQDKEFSLENTNIPVKISYINGKEEIFITW